MEIGDNFTINEIEVFREMYFISVIDGGSSFIDGVNVGVKVGSPGFIEGTTVLGTVGRLDVGDLEVLLMDGVTLKWVVGIIVLVKIVVGFTEGTVLGNEEVAMVGTMVGADDGATDAE